MNVLGIGFLCKCINTVKFKIRRGGLKNGGVQ